MHYYQFHIGDYASHTRHLSHMEDLAYRRLLDFYYLHEQPIKQRDIARQIGMRDHEQDVLTVLNEFFLSTDNGFISPRADKEIQQYQEFIAAGKRGAAKRWAKGGDGEAISPPNATPIATNNHNPLTNNHKPNSVAKATGDKSPLSPDEIIFGYGVPLLTNAGTADKQARSFLGGLRKAHGDEALVNALRECVRVKPLQPLEWLAKILPPEGIKPKLNKQEALEASNRAVVERLLKKEGLV
jgi:uncharacterized protein YdaU (DUF1376 family)